MDVSDEYLIEVPAELFIELAELACDGVSHGPLCDKRRRLAIRTIEKAGKILEKLAQED
jgi:hypothetical protein